ncbi:MAG TPA: protein kinase [Phototrophicaceae bacterium]|nr:protein kinase [Phototrophicaceae bacterium]
MKNRKFGKYEVLQRLGRGGMAEVYRAYHPNLDRYVAIKVLHSFLSDESEFKARFEKEAQNIARLRHPNIVQVYDFDYDADSDSYYMVMELIEGPTLKDYLFELPDGSGRLPLLEVVRIIRQAAEALSYAHQRGMIHRDVKPANLMLDAKENNRLVLTDFGIAKLLTGSQATVSGGLVGTPAYMSPEQGMGETGDERSDLYALGVIMYQMLTGELPYDAETPMALILQHMNDPIPSIRMIDQHLPPAADKVLQRLMAKEPVDRYQSALELIADLDILEKAPARLDPTTIVLPKLPPLPTDKPKTMTRPSATRRFPFAFIMLIIGLIIIGGGVYFVGAKNNIFPRLPFIAALFTETATPTETFTPTWTLTASETPTDTLTFTSTFTTTFTSTYTPTPTATNTATPTSSSTGTVTQMPTNTRVPPTVTRTLTTTWTPKASLTVAATETPTANMTMTVAAERTATTTACNFDYAIVEQVPPDGKEGGFFRINEPYSREIRLLNTGSCTWERLTSMTFLSGEDFSAGPRIFIEQPVEPADEVTVTFSGVLPPKGSVDPISGIWELRTPGQIRIGEPMVISVMVFDPGS